MPWPLTSEDRAAGYQHRLSIWQMEVSRPQVLTRPLRGGGFFEQIIRENLDLGRPARIFNVARVALQAPAALPSRLTRAFQQLDAELEQLVAAATLGPA